MLSAALLQVPVDGVEVERFIALALVAFAGSAFGGAIGALRCSSDL